MKFVSLNPKHPRMDQPHGKHWESLHFHQETGDSLEYTHCSADGRPNRSDPMAAQVDICIMARTDARATLGLDEAIERCVAFVEAGADITFLEAPRSEEEMKRYCQEVRGAM